MLGAAPIALGGPGYALMFSGDSSESFGALVGILLVLFASAVAVLAAPVGFVLAVRALSRARAGAPGMGRLPGSS